MSPEANVQEKLTVTMAPPPAALAADKAKAKAKKRSETENLIDGHAAGIKTDKPKEEQDRTLKSQGFKGGLLGFFIFGLIAFWTLTKYGRFLHADLVVETGRSALESAYHNLSTHEWFFGLSSRVWAFRIFATLSPLFLIFAIAIPRQFGRFWMGLGAFLGSFMTPIFISLLFYVGVTPLALLMKVIGKDPLRRAAESKDGTYWISRREPRKHDHFEHLF
jgi:hypothetical protein